MRLVLHLMQPCELGLHLCSHEGEAGQDKKNRNGYPMPNMPSSYGLYNKYGVLRSCLSAWHMTHVYHGRCLSTAFQALGLSLTVGGVKVWRLVTRLL